MSKCRIEVFSLEESLAAATTRTSSSKLRSTCVDSGRFRPCHLESLRRTCHVRIEPRRAPLSRRQLVIFPTTEGVDAACFRCRDECTHTVKVGFILLEHLRAHLKWPYRTCVLIDCCGVQLRRRQGRVFHGKWSYPALLFRSHGE